MLCVCVPVPVSVLFSVVKLESLLDCFDWQACFDYRPVVTGRCVRGCAWVFTVKQHLSLETEEKNK